MAQLKSIRKKREGHRPNLRLVPPPKRRRRPKWKIGRSRRFKYEHQTWLHRYEEDVVMRVIRENGGTITLATLLKDEGRWNRRPLGMTLMRLYRQKRLVASLGHGAHAKVPHPYLTPYLTFTIPPKPEVGDERT